LLNLKNKKINVDVCRFVQFSKFNRRS